MDPEGRYASTRDLASDVRSIREHLSEVSVSGEISGPARVIAAAPPPRRSPALRAAVAAAALLAAAAIGMLLQKGLTRSTPPSYQQITFGSGTIRAARFAPDGQTIIYSVAWDGNPLKLFLKHPSSYAYCYARLLSDLFVVEGLR